MDRSDLAIPEALRGHLRVGTCSWKYDSWKGLIYERGTRYGADGYLPDYARYFRTVEVDQWFWSLFPGAVKLPEDETVRTYAESVPEDFRFSVKAPNALTLTHFYAQQPKSYREYANRPNELFLSLDLLHRFLGRLAPMRPMLGPIMFQFAYLNRQKMASLEDFVDVLGRFFDAAPDGYEYAIETRNPNYLKPPFFDFLRERRLGFVFIDGYYMPPIGDVFAEHGASTADFAAIRLHGGDRKGIEEKTGRKWTAVVEPKEEGIRSAARIVRANAERGIRTTVNVNNHYEGCAPLTARSLLKLLAGPGTE